MKTVTDAVREILTQSDIATDAIRQGILNFSAYAEQIVDQVEQITWKPVQKNTVVVALTRVAKEIVDVAPLQPNIFIEELSIKAPLTDITFERTEDTLLKVQKLPSQLGLPSTHFLTITEGINEITLIVSQDKADRVLEMVGAHPKSVYRDLVGITMKFSAEYLSQPNVIFSLLGKLARQRINLLEIVSTYTELTVLIEEQDLERAVTSLKKTT